MRTCPSAAILLVLLASALSAQTVASDSTHAAAAAELVDVLQLEKYSAIDVALIQGPLTATNPMAEQIVQLMADFMKEVLPWDILGPEYVKIYQAAFSEAELRELISFYRSPLGQKLIAEGPNITRQVAEEMQRLMLPHYPELQRRISAVMGIGE